MGISGIKGLAKRLLVLALILCMAPFAACGEHLHDDPLAKVEGAEFSVLIIGDSQMAGFGWEGGYANCIKETYPGAHIINLAKSGAMLTNGGIIAQWELYANNELPAPDVVMIDGGANDLFYMPRGVDTDLWMKKTGAALRLLLDTIHQNSPESRVIYVTFPPLREWEDEQEGPPRYDAQAYYWRYMSLIASTYDCVTVLDLFSINPFRYPCLQCYQEYLVDSVHLSEAGYRKTYEHIDNILAVMMTERENK